MLLKLLYIGISAFFVLSLFGYLRAHPEALSKENLGRSFFTMGILALILIAFVVGLVLLVKA